MRFSEFKGEWETLIIADLCTEFKSGKNIKAEAIDEFGAFPVYGGNGLRGYTNRHNHDGNYVLIGRQGALCGNIKLTCGKCYITEHAIAVSANDVNETLFLQYLFIQMNLGQYSDQSAQPGLAVNKLLRLKVNLPKLEEQKRIASLLSLIDARISTQNKIIEKLESLIKGLCYSFIMINEPTVKIKDCLDCHSSTLSESEVVKDAGNYDVYGANGKIASISKFQMNQDSILIIKDGAGVGRVQYASGKHSAIGTLNYLTAKSGVYLKYIFYFLSIFNFERFIVGSGIPHIYFKDYGEAFFYCPSYVEQRSISNALILVSEKIETEMNILQKITEQKKYLLHNMFI